LTKGLHSKKNETATHQRWNGKEVRKRSKKVLLPLAQTFPKKEFPCLVRQQQERQLFLSPSKFVLRFSSVNTEDHVADGRKHDLNVH